MVFEVEAVAVAVAVAVTSMEEELGVLVGRTGSLGAARAAS